jgi:hypothetical protein
MGDSIFHAQDHPNWPVFNSFPRSSRSTKVRIRHPFHEQSSFRTSDTLRSLTFEVRRGGWETSCPLVSHEDGGRWKIEREAALGGQGPIILARLYSIAVHCLFQ